jgi:DNA-directed RNA polymerase subunit L
MNLKVVEKDKELLKLEFEGETETITQLLATQVWKEGGEAASVREHPFLEEPKLLVMGKNPVKILKKAASSLEKECEEFKEKFKEELKKA